MKSLLYLLGFLPSIIWLLFYLKKDKHPEPNAMVLKIFFYGMFSAVFAIFFEKGFQAGYNLLTASSMVNSSIIAIFLGGALIEEFLKYFVVKIGVFRNRELDEPPDIVLYMIISALGFAALENVLVLTNYHPILTTAKALEVMTIRFVSATFLHALCSAVLGYFIALSFYNIKKRTRYFLTGLGLATLLHGLYNWSIMKIEGTLRFALPLLILIVLSCFVGYSFKKLRKMQSTCKLQ